MSKKYQSSQHMKSFILINQCMKLMMLYVLNKTYISDKDRIKLSQNHNLKNDDEMFDLFSDLPEALSNNFYLPYKCNYKAKHSILLPVFQIMKVILIKC